VACLLLWVSTVELQSSLQILFKNKRKRRGSSSFDKKESAGELRRRLDTRDWFVNEQGTVELTRTDVEAIIYLLRQRYGDYWSKEHREMGLSELAEALTDHMTEWKLGTWRNEGEGGSRFVVSAIVSRWNADYSLDEEETGHA